ncbi:hypothetical protein FHS46_001311 [Variibacter gotjawalensis]|nr:hypothetical protein [Variibacter gotjawalensis]
MEWTREPPAHFQSSDKAQRGFCAKCGTPLTFETEHGVELAVGSFDDREGLAPQLQVNHADRISWAENISDAPIRPAHKDLANQEGIVSRQHPDHDT